MGKATNVRVRRDKDGDLYARHEGKRLRVEVVEPSHARDPFDVWVQETVSALARVYVRAPYDSAAMHDVRKYGGIPKLVHKLFPHLSAERQAVLIENMSSISHAKQREAERLEGSLRYAMKHRARRLSKKERRIKRKQNYRAASNLKALLKRS